jgi:hypothetical protein
MIIGNSGHKTHEARFCLRVSHPLHVALENWQLCEVLTKTHAQGEVESASTSFCRGTFVCCVVVVLVCTVYDSSPCKRVLQPLTLQQQTNCKCSVASAATLHAQEGGCYNIESPAGSWWTIALMKISLVSHCDDIQYKVKNDYSYDMICHTQR